MVGHLPSFLPDELLYSVLARYMARTRIRSRRAAIQQIFPDGGTAVIDLPANLDAFLLALPAAQPFDADYLIDQHSLFPYYEAFLPPERAVRLRAGLRGSGGRGIHTGIGLMAGRLRPPAFLRYCHGCDSQDRQQGRDLYWRRLHQLTGVEVCPRHRMFLADGVGTGRRSRSKDGFVDPGAARADGTVRRFNADDPEHALLLRLAEGAEYLLRRGRRPICSDWLHTRYLHLLCSHGLSTGTGQVRIKEVQRLFVARYGTPLLERLQCGPENGWISRLLRKPRGVQSPLRHLLMWDFLGFGAASFLENEEVLLFGAPPFPCLNPVCPQRGNLTITHCTVGHCLERRLPVAAMACPVCGYDYRRLGPDPQASRRWDKPDWVADYGPLWRQRLSALWADPGTSLREMARSLGVDPITVKRQANKLALIFPRPGVRLVTKGRAIYQKKPRKIADRTVATERRTRWLTLCSQHPLESRKRLRLRAPALWTALYRQDRPWLEANSPRRQKPVPASTYANWKTRDDSLGQGIEFAAEKLRARQQPFVRITVAALARELGAVALLQKHPGRLPSTISKIRSVVESREQFALRRLDAVVTACCAAGERLPSWRLAKMAGLRPDLCVLVSVRRALNAATLLMAGRTSHLPGVLTAA